ncbi:hypothetical protein BZG36_01183 [Bifiguratus adelaidae]|uniref:Uncharacterized protein n=1 Tax=Bifiguratus adelaidae TaxID=1938954 RepID=A0A261Y5R2_9FUNG|nr:hypothetical protein BZG36_01183 [Bifiguratus adelaidae]
METPEYLAALPKHRIFALSSEELSQWSEQQDTTRRGYNDEDALSKAPQSCMSIYNGHLLVAVGSCVRTVSLIELKNAWLTALENGEISSCDLGESDDEKEEDSDAWVDRVPYKVFDTPDITERICSLAISPNNRMLACVCRSSIYVIELPRAGIWRDANDKIQARTYKIGAFHHTNGSPKLAKVEWHPLSAKGCHLCVLTQDAIVRLYNVGQDINNPEQTFDFKYATGEKSRYLGGHSYGLSSECDQAVSFCFGKGDDKWGEMALYCLMQNGDVYGVCPFIPDHSVLPVAHFDNLSAFVGAQLHLLQDKASQTGYKDLLNTFSAQADWLMKAYDSVENNASAFEENSDSTADDTDRPRVIQIVGASRLLKHKLVRQGPFLLQPAPADLGYGDLAANDMCCVRNEVANIILLAYQNGQVDVCIETEPLEAKWLLKANALPTPSVEDPASLPVLNVYETVNLGFKERSVGYLGQPLRLVPDAVYGDTIYVIHAGGVNCIFMQDWLDELASYQAGDEEKNISNFFLKQTRSRVSSIVDTNPISENGHDSILGFCVFNDLYLSYSLIILTSTYECAAFELTLRSNTGAAELNEQLRATGQDDNSADYICMLTQPAFTVPESLDNNQGVPRRPKIVSKLPNQPASKEGLKMDEASLQYIASVVETFRNEIKDIHNAGSLIKKRVNMQQQELRRQVSKLRELQETISNTIEPEIHDVLDSRYSMAQENHQELRLRADRVLRQILEVYQPSLTDREKESFKELDRYKTQVLGDGGLKLRADQLLSQIKILQEKRQSNDTVKVEGASNRKERVRRSLWDTSLADVPEPKSNVPKAKMSRKQIQGLQKGLSEELKLLEDTKQALQSLQERLSLMNV